MRKNILITGISRGIGKNIYNDLKQNNNVFGISRSIVDEKNCYSLDLINYAQIDNFVQNINKENCTFFDIIILNAGVGYYGKFEDGNLGQYEEIINLNLLSNIRLLYLLKENISKKTKIIFIGSIASKKFMNNGSVYIASKFGIRGFAGALKSEGKKVHIINPKIVDTTFHEGKIDIDKKLQKTSMQSIIDTVNNIIIGNEKRFEIDL